VLPLVVRDAGMHALIIEADPFVAITIEQVLLDLGYTSIEIAATAHEAILAANNRCPDLITADSSTAAGCGIEAVQTICAQRPIPVVFVTEEVLKVVQRVPAALTVQKPFPLIQLTNAVLRARCPS